MKYVLDGAMSKAVDAYTIDKTGVPSLVLMERAALCVAEKTAQIAAGFGRNVRICAVCGTGNNGADGIAAARILTWQGLMVDILLIDKTKSGTDEYNTQKQIAINSGMNFGNLSDIFEYDIIIDAIFGTGLSKPVSGIFQDVIFAMNTGRNVIVSVDIPSGINATTGEVMGVCVSADATVTFGYHKLGMMLYPGKSYAGEITVADIGFNPEAIRTLNPAMYFTTEDVNRIPEREEESNKGTYGRTLVIAGSEEMSGAAYLSGAAAYRSGAGLVEIFTHEQNAPVIRTLLPEAIVTGYNKDNVTELLSEKIDKADYIILGPGLSCSETAELIVKTVFEKGSVPLILDADGLNIVAGDTKILKTYKSTVIITPHIGEMSRLTGISKADIKADIVHTAKNFADSLGVICVIKDVVTVICEPGEEGRTYINHSGCAAMSKGGMGDVLTGIIAGMLSLKLEPFSASAMGVYLHGLAGEKAVFEKNEHTLAASDLLEAIGYVMNK